MIHIKKFEDIKIPINVGDTILGGRFKNKKTVVKKIGKNAKGDITVNGKPLLKYRLVKESFEEETNDLLRSIMDMGMTVEIDSNGDSVRIYKQVGNESFTFDSPPFEWDEIRADVQAYISQMTEEFGFEMNCIYTIRNNAGPSHGFARIQHTEEEILNDKELGMIKCINIEFKKYFEKRISIFDQDIKSLLPEEMLIENEYGKHTLKKKDVLLNGNLIQIIYYQNTPDENDGDVTVDGEPDYLCIDIHTIKENDGTKANGDNLRLNIDITYGDAMVSEFTIEAPNKVDPHHYTGANSLYDPNSLFSFDDESLQALIDFFNRFSENYKLTKDEFKFLDKDPNSHKPY